MRMKKLKYGIITLAALLLCLIIPVVSVNALTQQQLYNFSQNNIMFYMPSDKCEGTVKCGGDELTWEDLNPLEGNDRLSGKGRLL